MSHAERLPGLVSTIIPVWNRSNLLVEAVESVIAQTYRSIEIIISDDGSTDGTVETAHRLSRYYPGMVRVIENSHLGPGPTREAGRLAARGEFIQYLDSDDLLHPRKFEVQVAALNRCSAAGVAYGRSRLVSLDGTVLRNSYKWTGSRRDQLFPGLLVDRWWCTHTPLYRASLLDEVGSWSDLRYSQDWEYDARVGKLQTLLVFCDEVVSDHRHHDSVRQTGRGNWLRGAQALAFFTSLHESAIAAGVNPKCPEMRHFARWVFAVARRDVEGFDDDQLVSMIALAGRAGLDAGFTFKWLNWYSTAAGLRSAIRLMSAIRRLGPGKHSRETLEQSWM